MSTKGISMLIAALLVGILLSMQWPGGASQQEEVSMQVEETIRQLELEQAELKRTVGLLREELNSHQREMGANTGLLEDLHSELVTQKMLAGLSGVQGPGLQVILADSQRPSVGNTSEHLVHDYDLRDVVALLWLAGAEAVAINDERIVNSSSIYCVGSTVLVNDTRLSPPYSVSAIGDARRLLEYVENPGYLRELKLRRARVGVRLEASPIDSIVIPAYQGSLPLKYARPGS
jgi:uncharacterized protein YlxW (UPF0749 family)